jgi:hypothetical protein
VSGDQRPPADRLGPRERERLERIARRHDLGRPPVTEHEFGQRRYLVAEVEPLDVNGVRTVAVGSALWVVAFVAMLPFVGTLRDNGQLSWLWTCIAGFGLGLLGLEYCRRRRKALQLDPSRRQTDTSPLGAAGT